MLIGRPSLRGQMLNSESLGSEVRFRNGQRMILLKLEESMLKLRRIGTFGSFLKHFLDVSANVCR